MTSTLTDVEAAREVALGPIPGVPEETQHLMLDMAKEGCWDVVYDILREHPQLARCQIAGRWSVCHQMVYHKDLEAIKKLAEIPGVNFFTAITARGKNHQSPLLYAKEHCPAIYDWVNSNTRHTRFM